MIVIECGVVARSSFRYTAIFTNLEADGHSLG